MASVGAWKILVAALVVLQGVTALPAPSVHDNEINNGRSVNDAGNWNMVMRILDECAEKDMMSCLGVKAVAVLDRAARMTDIELVDGVSFVKSGEDTRNSRALMTETEIENTIEQEPAGKTARLIDLIVESATRFFKTHSLQFRLPSAAPEAIQRAFEEGRKKDKKKLKTLMPIIMAIAAKTFALLPIKLGLVWFIASKALIVAKIALLIAGVLAFQRFFQGGGGLSSLAGQGNSNSGWSSSPSSGWSSQGTSGGWSSTASGGPYARSIDAHDLAYKAQAPAQPQTTQ